jgi:Zn2+/Cd2+-exporting ATPase
MEKLELELNVLLPAAPDERDGCAIRLCALLQGARGVSDVHTERKDGAALVCLHYDPDLVSMAALQRAAQRAGAEVSTRYAHDLIPIDGMDCSDCVVVIEHALRRLGGVLAVAVNYASQIVAVEYDTTRVARSAVVAGIERLGYRVPKTGAARFIDEYRELLFTLACGVFLLTAWSVERVLGGRIELSAPLFLAAYVLGGWNIARHAWQALREGHVDTDLLMIAAALGAAALGEFADGALLLFLFGLGHTLEELALDRARQAVRKLGELTPRTALVRRDGIEADVGVEQLAIGDVVIVRPGTRMPIDGAVVSGTSAVDQSPVTGESLPVEKDSGDEVFAGSLNGEGALEVRVSRLARDNTLARVMAMVEEAQGQKSRTQQLTERFTRYFVPAVLSAAALVLLVPLGFGVGLRDAFLRAMTLLVAASPCALALGPPSAMLAAIAQAARNGLLVKGGRHLETLGAVKVVAFDKTGTLTHGRPEVTDVVSVGTLGGDEVLSLAAAAERRSGHPLARAVVRAAEVRGIPNKEAADVVSLTGRGIRSVVEGREVMLGNRSLFDEDRKPLPATLEQRAKELEQEGKTTMFVGVDSEVVGVIALADTPRVAAAETIRHLRQVGVLRTLLLSGDNPRVAEKIGRDLGVDVVRAGLMPDQKVEAIRALASGETVAMVGDGVNDAPALAAASVGIALGGASTDVALETADVVLMGDDLSTLPFAIGLGRATKRVVWQNLAVSILTIAMLAAAAVLGIAGIGLTILVHEGSTLVVVANSLRLLGYRRENQSP